MKAKEARATCSKQKCESCKGCVFNASPLDEWEMDLMPTQLEHGTTSQLNERIRLDAAIEAAALAG